MILSKENTTFKQKIQDFKI